MQLAVDESGRPGRQEEPEPLLCSVTAAPGSRLDFSWGLGQLHIAEVASPSTGAGGVQPYAGSCEWTSLSPIQRKTAYGMMPPYTRLQRVLLHAGCGVPEQARQARLEFSDEVQAVLQEACSVLASGGDGEDELHVGYEAALWELLVLCFLRCDDLEMGALPEAFAGWMLQHGSLFNADQPGFSQLHAKAAELMQDPRVDTNPTYWPTVHRLVLLGQVELAGSLLTRHPVMAASNQPGMADMAQGFEQVYQALREVPRLGRDTGSDDALVRLGGAFTEDIVQFNAEREQWEFKVHELCDHRKDLLAELQHTDPAAAKGLAGILVMLTADPSKQPMESLACKRMAKAACNWVELMTGMMLWQHRLLPFVDLPAEASVAQMLLQQPRNTDRDFHDFFTQVFVAASQQQVQEVIQLCTNSSYTSITFVAHSFEVMRGLPEAARVISRPLPHLGCDQAESFLLNYAEVLVGGASTWAVGAEYLAWCPVYGADALEVMLEKSPHPLVDQQSALQALAIARRHSLAAAACNLARRISAAEERRGHMACALQWALQARDPQRCAQLVAPLIVKILDLLSPEGAQQFGAAPLDLPELHDLEPLLLNLPDSSAGSAQQQQQGTQQQQWQPRTQRYPELHLLRAMLQLQQALEEVQRCQQPVQQPEQLSSGSSARNSVNSTMQAAMLQQQNAARQAAYAQVQHPVQQLLLDTPALAPAELQLPLLVYLAPVLESVHMPFSRDQVDGLLALKQKRTQAGAEAIAIAEGSGGKRLGLKWPEELSYTGPKAAALKAAGLALLNGRSRANVKQYSMQAW